MINKRFISAPWRGDGMSSHFLNVFSKGIDPAQFRKVANTEPPGSDVVRPEKGFSHLLLITTGAGERFGANNNADFFNEKTATVTFPEPKGDRTMTLDGGLQKYHGTYMQFGGVYREHANGRKGHEKLGSVVWERVNPEMHWGEVIVKLPDDKWHVELQKVAKGEPVFWSMGAGVPFDICSICGNKAHTRKEYCDHMRNHKLELTKEGHQVYVYNDQPHFHDISCVAVPADRIAFTLAKVASGRKSLLDLEEEEPELWIPVGMAQKIASFRERDRLELLQKLAELEKQMQGCSLVGGSDLCDAFDMPREDEEKVVQELKDVPVDQLTTGLKSRNMLLPPRCFVRIVLKKDPDNLEGSSNLPGALSSVFRDILGGDGLMSVLDDSSYVPGMRHTGRLAEEKLDGLEDKLSLNEKPVQMRIVKITITGSPKGQEKAASGAPPSEVDKVVAREYAKYQLSFLAQSRESGNETLAIACKA